MGLFKTILCFVLALFIATLIFLGIALLNDVSWQHINSLPLEWGLMFALGVFHKFGLVAVCLAFIFYFLPKHFPRLFLTVIIAFALGILYNAILLEWVENGLLSTLHTTLHKTGWSIMVEYLIYYGVVASFIALIGGFLCKYIDKHT